MSLSGKERQAKGEKALTSNMSSNKSSPHAQSPTSQQSEIGKNTEKNEISDTELIKSGLSDIRVSDNNKNASVNVPPIEFSYISSFFIGLSFRNGLRTADITPSIQEFLGRVNTWDGKKPTMDLSVYPRTRDEIPSFVFETKAEPSSIRGCTPAKTFISVNRNTDLQSPVFALRQNSIDTLTKGATGPTGPTGSTGLLGSRSRRALRRGLPTGIKDIVDDDDNNDGDDFDEACVNYQTPTGLRRPRRASSNTTSGSSESGYDTSTDSQWDDYSYDPEFYNAPASPEADEADRFNYRRNHQIDHKNLNGKHFEKRRKDNETAMHPRGQYMHGAQSAESPGAPELQSSSKATNTTEQPTSGRSTASNTTSNTSNTSSSTLDTRLPDTGEEDPISTTCKSGSV
jgi:hypothetical protein